LRRFPNLKIFGHGPAFWSEIGQLETPGDRGGYPSYPVKEEGVVPTLFRRYGNLYGDLSAGSGSNAFLRDRKYAVKFLNEFQDRLFFGSDICSLETPVRMVHLLQELKESGDISEETFQKIARKNAIRIFNL
jgi:predicted TIM-barrel fold metal-dependent hydrolase